jgi:hypothetical protein
VSDGVNVTLYFVPLFEVFCICCGEKVIVTIATWAWESP